MLNLNGHSGDGGGSADDFENPVFAQLVGRAKREEAELGSQREDPTALSPQTTPDTMNDYIAWRAQGKSWRDSAKLSGITERDANILEKADDIFERIQAVRQSIINDPGSALEDMVPLAIGMLREKVREGHITAAQEVLRLAKSYSKTTDKEKKSEVRGPAKTAADRGKVERAGNEIRSQYRSVTSSAGEADT